MTNWLDAWSSDDHAKNKTTVFNALDTYIDSAPVSILDIGCGLAIESEMFQKKYNSNLFLLDGDFDDSIKKNRDRNYGDMESFKFYNKLDTLKQSYDERCLSYTFIDAANIQIDPATKFDIVYSIMSCGFHYPLGTYAELIKRHTTSDSKIIVDIRNGKLDEQGCDFEIIDTVHSGRKHAMYQIKFL